MSTPSSSSLRALRCAADHMATVPTAGVRDHSAQTTSGSVVTTAPTSDPERDDRDVPTLRSILVRAHVPAYVAEPDPAQGAVIYDARDCRHHAYAPGPVFLGSYTTRAQAQRRLDLFHGRPIRLAKTGVRRRDAASGGGQ
jgi:hypothetical protein